MPDVSIIVPVLNEAAVLAEFLEQFVAWRGRGDEVIVVDGGSRDASRDIVEPNCDQVISAQRGRASQLNAGAQVAHGRILWFVHADTKISPTARNALIGACAQANAWGRFDVGIDDRSVIFRAIEASMNMRSRMTGIATGDQGIFVRRELFDAVGGFRPIALMEDIELSKSLRERAKPYCLGRLLTTSSRRWRERGVLKTVLTMWGLRLAWFAGVAPERLARIYGYR